MIRSLFDKEGAGMGRKTRAVGPHKTFKDAYAAAIAATDHVPADAFLTAMLGVPSGTLSSVRANLAKDGYEFHSKLVPGINGEKERVYQVIKRPAKAIPAPDPEPAPAVDPATAAIIAGLAKLDPADRAALAELIGGATNGNGNGK